MPKIEFEGGREPAVLDSNMYVSAILFPRSVPAQALAKVRRRYRMLACRETWHELLKTLLRSKFDRYLSLDDRLDALRTLRSEMSMVELTETVSACRDPKDDKFLSLALAGSASILITGDNDLLALHPFGNVKILKPADFLAL